MSSKEPRPLWIIATPRTGTTLLQKLLNQTGLFHPHMTEWYNPQPYFDDQPWPMGETPPRNNKVFPHHLSMRFGRKTLEPILEAWPDLRVVVMYRNDKAAQTASWLYSVDSGIWNTQDPGRLARYRATKVNPDSREVLRHLSWIVNMDSMVASLTKDLPRMTIEYNEMVSQPIARTLQVLSFAGVPAHEIDINRFDLDLTTKKLEHPGKNKLAEDIRKWANAATEKW